MSELNRHPFSYNVLKQTLAFLNKIMDQTDDDLLKLAMVESISMAKEGKRGFSFVPLLPCNLG